MHEGPFLDQAHTSIARTVQEGRPLKQSAKFNAIEKMEMLSKVMEIVCKVMEMQSKVMEIV